MSGNRLPSAHEIVFGMSRAEDQRSLAYFLQLIGSRDLATVLASRMSSGETEQLVAMLSRLMRTHLSKEEYHQLFLGEEPHPR